MQLGVAAWAAILAASGVVRVHSAAVGRAASAKCTAVPSAQLGYPAISRARNTHAVFAWRKQITKKGVINGGESSEGDVLCRGGSPVARVQLRRELVCGTLEIGQCFSVSNQRDDVSSSL